MSAILLREMDRETVEVYETRADDWLQHRKRPIPASLPAFAERVEPGTLRLDLGCGPGGHTERLGEPVVALDAAAAMLEHAAGFAPGALRVQADLESLPFRRGSISAVWAHKCYMHIAAERLPMALADLHHTMRVDTPLHVQVTSDRIQENADDIFPGRLFTWWPAQRLADVVEGAGFLIDEFVDDGEEWLDVEARRGRRLADTVGAGMRVLLVGLNPSEYAADAGVGFARPGNRFWPAALASGLVTAAHDPVHALRVDRVGMTDLVKRATVRADEISHDEFRAGAARVERLVEWLRPDVVCFVGLAGYRASVDRSTTAGWQPTPFGGRPAYVMPNPSGLNTHTRSADFVAHLRAVQAPAAT
jgi:TDG/mug DNA glycosylase family protein